MLAKNLATIALFDTEDIIATLDRAKRDWSNGEGLCSLTDIVASVASAAEEQIYFAANEAVNHHCDVYSMHGDS